MSVTTPRISRSLAELAGAGFDHRAFALRADALLRQAIGYDLAVWPTADPATLIPTSCTPVDDGPHLDPDGELRFFRLEWSGEDPNSFAALARRPVPAAALRASVGDPAGRVRRYDELMAGFGIYDELRTVLRLGDACWGFFIAYRIEEPSPFTEEDVARAAAASEPLARGFRRAFLLAALDHAGLDDPPGQMIVGPDGELLGTTRAAERFLQELSHSHLPTVVRSLLARPGYGTATVAGKGGPITFHLMELEGRGGETAVVVERPQPARLAPLIMEAHGLTERERQVLELALQGRTSRQAATELGISRHTVHDHLKAIYAKVGVASRGELMAELFTSHYLPPRLRGTPPGPYRYFLEREATDS